MTLLKPVKVKITKVCGMRALKQLVDTVSAISVHSAVIGSIQVPSCSLSDVNFVLPKSDIAKSR